MFGWIEVLLDRQNDKKTSDKNITENYMEKVISFYYGWTKPCLREKKYNSNNR